MNGFCDIHAHFVYGLDDGAKTRRDMEAMLDAAHADGIAFLMATPHVSPGVWPFDEALFRHRLDEARAYCARRGYALELGAGAEILYTPALAQRALEGRLPTLAGSEAILLEFAPGIAFEELSSAVALLERRGYRTILAHVERYHCLRQGRNAEHLRRAYDVRYQLNAATLLRARPFWKDGIIHRWLREGLIDYIATDAHDCAERPSNMSAAYHVLLRRVGQARADEMTGLSGYGTGNRGENHGDKGTGARDVR